MVAAAACALALTAPATTRADEGGAAGSTDASEILASAAEAIAEEPEGGVPDREATAALAELADVLPSLEGGERRQAEEILARPTDGPGDPFGDGYTVPAGQVRSLVSAGGHFCVFYVTSSQDAPPPADANVNLVPDYVERIGEIAEESYAVEVGELGWIEPKPDDGHGCGGSPAERSGRADIYLKNVGAFGLFGYEASDPDSDNQGRSRYGYLVIDDDYAPQEFPNFASPLDAARVTVAHEFNHLLHDRYDSFQDLWLFETSAVWMEEQVFPAVDDYLHYVPRFAATPGTPLTFAGGAGGLKIYGSSVWNHWLQGGYGPDVVRRAWEVSDSIVPRDFAVEAFDRAIADLGGRSFSREFARFTAATAEWRTGDGGFPDASEFPDVRRKGTLRPGARKAKRFQLDHTAYRLFRVKKARARRIRLRVKAEPRVRTGLALVAREGNSTAGEVVRKVQFLPRGGEGDVSLTHLGRFERVTAVVANADGRANEFGAGDWEYRKDRRQYVVRVERRG